jgi:hypothetical protein
MFLDNPAHESTLGLIPDGPPGIYATLKYMGGFVQDGKKLITVRNKALALVAGLKQKDWSGEVCALHGFVRDFIRYVGDISDVETVQSADTTLRLAAGDCDDKSILLAALLEAIGHPTKFVAIGFQPGVFEHVYVETKIGNKWIPLETTEPVDAGWAPSDAIVKARMEYFN